MGFEEFKRDIQKLSKPRRVSVTNSYGITDIYKWFHENKFFDLSPFTRQQFSKIIKGIHALMIQELLKGKDIVLPLYMGTIELRKYPRQVSIKDGKVKTNLQVDWLSTLKAWYEDNQLKENKTLVMREAHTLFKIYYRKKKARYKNKIFYKFLPTRSLKKRISEQIINNNIDAFLLWTS